MPFYLHECPRCGHHVAWFGRVEDVDSPCCGCGGEWTPMRWVPQGNSKPKPFVPFVTKHLKKWYGGPVEVTSLSQLRRIEKECGVIWEPGSFDSEHYGCEEPYRENPPKFRIPYDA